MTTGNEKRWKPQSPGFDTEGGQSFLRPCTPGASRTSFMHVPERALRPGNPIQERGLGAGTLPPGPIRAAGVLSTKEETNTAILEDDLNTQGLAAPHPASPGGKAAWGKVRSERCTERGPVTRNRALPNPRGDSEFQELQSCLLSRRWEEEASRGVPEGARAGSGRAREPCCRVWTSPWRKPGALEESWA